MNNEYIMILNKRIVLKKIRYFVVYTIIVLAYVEL